jgi:hypothetical protein
MGYIGNKMSVRAYEAYEGGEKPLSKWTKKDIIEGVLNNRDDFSLDELNKYHKESLKCFLTLSSWHHTGSYFNETDFYSLYDDFIELEKDRIIKVLDGCEKDLKSSKQKVEPLRKCFITYIEWAGTRKHPKAIDREAYGIIKGDWVYTEYGKKSLKGKYVHITKEFDKAPCGTAAIFKSIEKRIKK